MINDAQRVPTQTFDRRSDWMVRKTLIHEYIAAYGFKAALKNLLLYASRPSIVNIEINLLI